LRSRKQIGFIVLILVVLGLFLGIYHAGVASNNAAAEIAMGMDGLQTASLTNIGAEILEECARTACVAAKAAEMEAQERAEREAAIQAAREAEAASQAALRAASYTESSSQAPVNPEPQRPAPIRCSGFVDPSNPSAPITYQCDDGSTVRR
jgi:hypothetical protein